MLLTSYGEPALADFGIASVVIEDDTVTETAAKYAPKDVVVTQGRDRGELIVSWSMPIRPDVVATVIYEGAGARQARTIVNYGTNPKAPPQATLHGLPGDAGSLPVRRPSGPARRLSHQRRQPPRVCGGTLAAASGMGFDTSVSLDV